MIFNVARSEKFRCGWTCPKAVGNATIRNRLKRWSREWLRGRINESPELPPAVDLNIGFRAMPEDFYRKLAYEEFSAAMERGWKGILKSPPQIIPLTK
jgi:ribonuclease P protein component